MRTLGFRMPALVLVVLTSLMCSTSGASQQRGTVGLFIKASTEGDGSAEVLQVKPDGPADRAGLRKGDRITAINGERVEVRTDLDVLLVFDAVKAGEAVRVGFRRGGTTSEVLVVPEELSPEAAKRQDEVKEAVRTAYAKALLLKRAKEGTVRLVVTREGDELQVSSSSFSPTEAQHLGRAFETKPFLGFVEGLPPGGSVELEIDLNGDVLDIRDLSESRGDL